MRLSPRCHRQHRLWDSLQEERYRDLARPFVKHARIKIEQFCLNDLKHAMLDVTTETLHV